MSVTACVTYELRVEKPRAASSVGARATYGSRLRILRWHADVVSSSSFRFSLRIFEQKRDCSQSSSLSPGQFKGYEGHQNMFNLLWKKSCPDSIESCSLYICIPTTSSVRTSEKSFLPQGEPSKAMKGKHHRPRGVGKCLLPEKSKTLTRSKEEYSAFEVASTPYCRPVCLDGEVSTDLTASEIEVSSV